MNYPTSWLTSMSIGEKIACEVRLKIIRGDISIGSVLSENHLAQEFGASRSPVRDALRVLANEGLIRLERMGAVVLGLSKKDMEELYDVRILIETYLLKTISKTDQTRLSLELNKVIDKMTLAMEHRNPIDFSYQDLIFHELIVIESKHERLLRVWYSLKPVVLTALLVATTKRFEEDYDEIQQLIDKHTLIIDALLSQDDDLIEQTLLNHFQDTRTTVYDSLWKEDIQE
ncbi:GntR family transcriptional regulator [Peribacillus huizhouensis]|uniref:GntR family transcriptional regulator of gluconate operon n=1 Tax=Peribacillus huizhouensis TaxID=1501239 RepID=A0ABR6CQV5_9BACI|nr:GntR family transcriptional regulator [Peribacillus huizhouensis]MBA9027422.1 GntR family transcriptional regulator of gluconate operon [Peribacillus huizhouensis]